MESSGGDRMPASERIRRTKTNRQCRRADGQQSESRSATSELVCTKLPQAALGFTCSHPFSNHDFETAPIASPISVPMCGFDANRERSAQSKPLKPLRQPVLQSSQSASGPVFVL